MADFAANLNTGYIQGQTRASGNVYKIVQNSTLNSYAQFSIWQAAESKAAEENALIELKNMGDFDSEEARDEAFEKKYAKAVENAGSFSFIQEGKTYNESLQDLAQADLDNCDTIEKDGKITLDEFKQREIADTNAVAETEADKISEDDTYAMQMIETSFNFMDLNGDNAIDINEIKAYYTVADILDGANGNAQTPEEAMDGVITFASTQAMQDTMSIEGENYSKQYENRNYLKSSMTQIYQTLTAENVDETPEADDNTPDDNSGNEGDNTPVSNTDPTPLPFYQSNEPSEKGKLANRLTKSFFG